MMLALLFPALLFGRGSYYLQYYSDAARTKQGVKELAGMIKPNAWMKQVKIRASCLPQHAARATPLSRRFLRGPHPRAGRGWRGLVGEKGGGKGRGGQRGGGASTALRTARRVDGGGERAVPPFVAES
jgi:hypothetical protein